VQWYAIKANNTASYIGSDWTDSPTNYGTGVNIGGALFLPAAGARIYTDGALGSRGKLGSYWSSSEETSTVNYFIFDSSYSDVYDTYRPYGFSVRCISL
ncbi:hypothetical protein HZP32_18500, partial [Elizabethkingia anophelis]|nr:hypothetical protein [Elizabethkingia anophelis]